MTHVAITGKVHLTVYSSLLQSLWKVQEMLNKTVESLHTLPDCIYPLLHSPSLLAFVLISLSLHKCIMILNCPLSEAVHWMTLKLKNPENIKIKCEKRCNFNESPLNKCTLVSQIGGAFICPVSHMYKGEVWNANVLFAYPTPRDTGHRQGSAIICVFHKR